MGIKSYGLVLGKLGKDLSYGFFMYKNQKRDELKLGCEARARIVILGALEAS